MPPPKAELQSLVAKLAAEIDALPEADESPDQKASKVASETSLKLSRDLESPLDFVLKLWLQSHQSATVRVAIEGGWFNALADGKEKTAKELSAAVGAEEGLIVRMMRLLTAAGIVEERGYCLYKSTPISHLLTIPPLRDGCIHFTDNWAPVLTALPEYFAGNKFRIPTSLSDCPQTTAYNGREMWQLFEEEPRRGKVFHSVMGVHRDAIKDWLHFYPFQEQIIDGLRGGSDAVLMIDVGGGQGHELPKIRSRFEKHPGRLVLQDQASVVDYVDAKQAQGMEISAHDIFKSQPIQGAKAYYLRDILHDWSDAASRAILRHIAAAMTPGYSRLLLNDLVMPESGAPLYAAYRDLSVMYMCGGLERTSQQWQQLLDSVGLRIVKIWNEDGYKTRSESIVEAELKD